MERVLVVDDEEGARHFLSEALTHKGFQTLVAENGRVAIDMIESEPSSFSMLYTDLRMPIMGGLDLIQRVVDVDRRIVPVLLSGYADRVNLVAALRAGAYDFICKPYTLAELEASINRAIERRRLLLQNDEYRQHLEKLVEERNAEITGTHDTLSRLYQLGDQAFSMTETDPRVADFVQYAADHFHPDTFGIFVRTGDSVRAVATQDRFGRPFDPTAVARPELVCAGPARSISLQKQNRRGYCFPLNHDAFDGFVYVGYDSDRVELLDKQNHIFGLFRDRLHSHLKEHYMVQRHQRQARQMFVSSIQAHARSIEAKDVYTAGHCDRVDRYAEILARQAGRFSESWIFSLKVASILHDIGKIGISGSILTKPQALSAAERLEIQEHPVIGARIVRSLYGFDLGPAVRHHHERWDGKGYPDGLAGDAIPVESRFIFAADTFDAMTGDRPYRRAMSTEEAIDELKRCSGMQFDPDVVRCAEEAAPQLLAAREELASRPQGEYFARVE